MNWKEQFDELDCVNNGYMDAGDIKKFISTEIIEKLIADIPEPEWGKANAIIFKKALRDKWL